MIKKEESPEKTEVKQKVIEIIEQVEKIINKLTNIINKGYDEDVYNHIEISISREKLVEDLRECQSIQLDKKSIYKFKKNWIVKSKTAN